MNPNNSNLIARALKKMGAINVVIVDPLNKNNGEKFFIKEESEYLLCGVAGSVFDPDYESWQQMMISIRQKFSKR